MQRVAVVGKTGSGKTTLAKTLARRLSLEHIELDSISWAPNWVLIPREDFRARVDCRTRAPRWVTDGNYRQAREIIWRRADTLVWLDFPLWLVLWRITARTLTRVWRQEVLWGTNTERLDGLFGRDSLFYHALRTHRAHRIDFPATLQLPQFRHLKQVRLATPRALDRWLAEVVSQT